MGLRSGLSGGVGHQLISFSWKYHCTQLLVCFGSLSWRRQWLSEKLDGMKGTKAASKMVVYLVAVILVLNSTISVVPVLEIPLQTCTFAGCLGAGWMILGSPIPHKCFLFCYHFFNLTLAVFASRTSWQYLAVAVKSWNYLTIGSFKPRPVSLLFSSIKLSIVK